MSEVEDIIARAFFTTVIPSWDRPGGPPGFGSSRPATGAENATAIIAALSAAGYVIAPKAEATVLTDWIELWDKVCDAADPDDEQELPPWPEVVKQVLPEWNGEHVVSAEYWSEYQKAALVYAVRDFRRALIEAARP